MILIFQEQSDFTKFTACVAAFSQLLRNSPYKGEATYDQILAWTRAIKLRHEHGHIKEFKELVQKAKPLK